MARITRVKKAQQRFATKPVLDDQGNPVKIALTNKDGSPKMTSGRRGKTPRPVFITKTERDRTKPLANLRCDFPGCTIDGGEILPGSAYMWIKPKSGPYGGHQRNRHQAHPAWNVWDYSSSLSAQVARIEHDATSNIFMTEGADDVTSALSEAAEAIRELAEQKREGAQNIEDGFGHPTYQSEELEQTADDLDGWADEVEQTEVQDLNEFPCDNCAGSGEQECQACDGTGKFDGEDDGDECQECEGSGEQECGFCDGTGEDLEAAREAWSEAVQEALGNCPV